MCHYKLKLTALTPIHIGTGEAYEPINFIIDNGYLYEFDEIKFYNQLPNDDKKLFVKLTEKRGYDSLFEIHRFIKSRKEYAKKSYIHKVQVSKSFQKEYDRKIGRAVQKEGRVNTKKVFNRFEIEKTIRMTNTKQVYIPGSSLKGAISTAYQEYIFKDDKRMYNNFFKNRNPSKNLFKELLISDTIPKKTYSMIGYAVNKERFEEDNQGPSVKLETIFSNFNYQSIFEADLKIKEFVDLKFKIYIEDIKNACNAHYLPIFKQMFKYQAIFKNLEVDEWTNEYFSDEFYEKYKDLELNENQFLIRVGKYSQARAVTIDGMRKIKVKKNRRNSDILDQETTTWMFAFNEKDATNLMPFGWILCEIIDKD